MKRKASLLQHPSHLVQTEWSHTHDFLLNFIEIQLWKAIVPIKGKVSEYLSLVPIGKL